MSAPRIVVGKLAPALNATAAERAPETPGAQLVDLHAALIASLEAPAPAVAQAVHDILDLAVEHLGGLALPTTILCAPAARRRSPSQPTTWRSLLITTSGAVHKAAQAAGVPVFSGGSWTTDAKGERARTYGELGAMALAMANERAFPADLDRWCDAKRRGAWKLIDANALAGLPEANVVGRPTGGATFRELAAHYGFELLGVGVGEPEGLELLKAAKESRQP